MNKLISMLPLEVQNIIISYSYKFQPLDLRRDIISYFETRNMIIEIFNKRYRTLSQIYKNNIIYKQLIFHIISYTNGLQGMYKSNIVKLNEIFNRNYVVNANVKKLNLTIKNLFDFNWKNDLLPFRFRLLWGLLTPEERNEFLNINIKFDKDRLTPMI